MHRHGWRTCGLACGLALVCGCLAPQPFVGRDEACLRLVDRPLADGWPARAADEAAAPAGACQSRRTASPARSPPYDQTATPVSFQDETTEPDTPSLQPAPAEPRESGKLTLAEVVASVQRSYPLLEVAYRERQIAQGKELAAWGEFDLGVKAYGIAAPTGYYKNYRNGIGLRQPTFCGGYVYGGYKLGRGDIEPWYRERETNEGGEFSIGVGMPLLQNRAIDKRRGGVALARLARQAVEPEIQTQLIEFVREATQTYWYWVAAGRSLQAQQQLLRLAQQRAQQVEERVQRGDLERIARIDNQRLIAAREAKAIDAERKLQMAAIKLSLFVRTPQGTPWVPVVGQLPDGFPATTAPEPEHTRRDIAAALAARPELQELDLLLRQAHVELAQAENLLLPKLDAGLQAAQDVGAAANAKGDKTPFQLEAGLYGEVALQRREAQGKIAAARGKLAQLRAKRTFVENKIAAQVQDAVSALTAAAVKIDLARINWDLSRQSLALGREAFNAGDIDLIVLNIYEQAVTDAELLWIDAQEKYFDAQADYRAALAADPWPE